MPRHLYFEGKVHAMMSAYKRAFPTSLYPGSCELHTHITPNGRLKKLLFIMDPHSRASGMAAIVACAHRSCRSKTRIKMTVVNLITCDTVTKSFTVSETDETQNRSAMDGMIMLLQAQVLSVGPARPDHYAE
jgi:hypothetical protein